METTIERQKMNTTTLRNIKGSEFPLTLQNRFKIQPHQSLKVTIEVEDENEEYDTFSVEEDIITSLKEIITARKKGVHLPNIDDLLNSI
jgi:hypothetical protein